MKSTGTYLQYFNVPIIRCKIYFACLIFVVVSNHEIFLTMKISRFTVCHVVQANTAQLQFHLHMHIHLHMQLHPYVQISLAQAMKLTLFLRVSSSMQAHLHDT